MNAKTAERIAAARAAQPTRLYRLDLAPTAAILAGSIDLSDIVSIADRGGYGVCFRATSDVVATTVAGAILDRMAITRGKVSTGLGVHRREVHEFRPVRAL